jgi:hypothetical protein
MGKLAAGNVRLTKYTRERIRNEILQYKYAQTSGILKELIHEHKSLATMAYNTLGESNLAKLEALPNGWIQEVDYIRIAIGSDMKQLNFSGSLVYDLGYSVWNALGGKNVVETVKPKRVPNSMTNCFTRFEARDDFANRYSSYYSKVMKVKEEYGQTSRMVTAALAAATTSNRLIETWPESKPFVDKVIGTPVVTSTAISVPIATLNEKLGLPVPS